MEASPTSNIPRDTFPRTPPYTPHNRQPFLRSDSPASPYTPYTHRRQLQRSESPASVQSIHPVETISPRKLQEQINDQSSVQVEELHEGDAGYITDTELIYPEELEEPRSPTHSQASLSSSSSSSSDAEESEITHHFSRLGCADGGESPLERRRRLQRKRKCAESRVFKRPHSLSVQGDAEMTDTDGMPDHDRSASARRLRRRVRGPSQVQVVFEATPPPSRGSDAAARASPGIGPSNWHDRGKGIASRSADDTMDVDESLK